MNVISLIKHLNSKKSNSWDEARPFGSSILWMLRAMQMLLGLGFLAIVILMMTACSPLQCRPSGQMNKDGTVEMIGANCRSTHEHQPS